MILVAMLCLPSACSPTFDWREVRAGESLMALFPCRPQSHVRQVALDGRPVEMELLSCAAGGSTFALSRVVVDDQARTDSMLRAMRNVLVVNLSSTAASGVGDSAQGSTEGPGRFGGLRVDVLGSGPQGEALRARGEFFSRGSAIFQATVVGGRLDPEAVDFFFSSLEPR